jgi:large subunit ribosomal protein L29
LRAHEIRQLGDQEIKDNLASAYRELLNIRFRLATKQMANTSEIRVVKKNIARLSTIMNERQLGES